MSMRKNKFGRRKAKGSKFTGGMEPMEPRQLFAAHILGNPTSYATIQAAVNAAAPGATINVDPGTYNETVYVTEPLTILGANAGISGTSTSRGAESIVYATQTVFAIYANDVTINGFTIEGDDADIGAALGAGVQMEPSIHGTHILNNIIQNNVTGIYLSNNSNTDECVIQHNLIQNNFEANNNWQTKQENGSRAIYTDGTVSGGYLTNVLIDSNTIGNFNYNAGDEDEGLIALQALTAGKQFNIAITNNYITDGSKALLATNVTNLVFMGNTCTGLQDGSSGPVRFEGDANNIDIQYNTIYGNVGPGVASDDSGVSGDNSGFVVDNNNIYNNDGIGLITIANLYDGTVYAQNDWWGSASGPGGDGPGTGQAVWANGTTGHYLTPKGSAGGYVVYSPWATSMINIANIPVPAAASALAISPAASGQLVLNWTAPSSTATNQIIQRSTDGVNFTTIAVVPALLNTYTDTGLATGTTYTYRVITTNATGNGAASNTAAAAPPVYQAPVPVSGITETSAGPNSIAMQWNVPYYPYGIANYNIYRNGVLVGTSTTTSFTDTGLTADTAYTYTVTTTDTTGAVSSPSAATSLTTGHSQFLDPSFELTPAANVYDPVTANWTFTGKSAIENSGGAYGTVSGIPSGTQFAVIQGISGSIGAISQTMTVKTTGAYTISLYIAQRSGYTAQPVTVSLDGTVLGTFTPTSNTFTLFTTNAFALYAGTHTFTFSGTLSSGDNDSFIDQVSLNLVGNASTPGTPVLTTVGAASATSANVTWAAGGFGATGYYIQRSTDGINWTTIASNLSATTTSYTDSGLSPSTTYYYAVYAVDQIGGSPASSPASVTTLSGAAIVIPLSSLTWTSATSGYKTVEQNASVNNNTLTLHGQTYATGLGTSAQSVIKYSLGGTYTEFTTDVGIDAEENSAGASQASVDFQVIGDGKVLFDSGDLGISSPTVHIAVPVTGVQNLTLVATNGVPGIAYDHADWAGAELYTNPVVAAAPTGLSAVAVGTNSIGLTWSLPAASTISPVTGYAIDRSTDGVNFTTVATGLSGSATSWTDTSTLTAGTTYYYRIRALNAAGASANSVFVSAATFALAPVTVPITTLPWISATAGYGTAQVNQSISGNPLNLHGVTYPTGIGTHASSVITYNLGGSYSVFSSDIGIDNEESGVGTGSVDFQVLGDGKLLFDSGVLTSASPTVHFAVNVTGVQILTLVANNGIAGSISYDHADWAGAALMSSAAQALVAPTGLTAVATSGTSVNLTWASTAPNATGFTILRSPDGVNFTTLMTGLASTARSYTDSTASSGVTYYYEVVANDGAISSPASNIASATTIAATSITTNLSSLAWTSATAGYGSVQTNQSVNGNPITLKGVVYPSGISANAASTVVYNLGGNYSNFLATIGIDDEENGRGTGSVDFQVYGNGTLLFDSGVLTNASPAVNIDLSMAGINTLTLVASNGIPGNIDYDHADWAGARLISSAAQALVAPANVTAVATSATQVGLNWTSSAVNATGFVIQRSTDGVNFTTIATLTTAAVTSYTDTSAAAGTKYYYQVLATGSGLTSAASNMAAATTQSATAIVTNLTSLTWTSATAGYGSVQQNQSVNGNPITLKGTVYPSGLAANAVSNITYNLGGGYTNFLATIGIDDEENGRGIGSVDFQVYGDGTLLYDSGVLTNASPAVNINVPVAGVQTLTLVANNGVAGTIDYDHADWAGARLLSTAVAPASPGSLVAVAESSSQINLQWTAPSGTVAATGYLVQRSTDGVNFTTIATLGTVTNYFDTNALSAGTNYTYRVLATNSVGNSNPSVTATATTLAASAVITPLSSLAWVSATTGYGTVQTNSTVSGNTITLRGVTYASGIGTHALSSIVYNLNGAYTNFISDVGVDDEENGKGIGSVDFQVIGDGKVLFDSGVLTNQSPIVSINVNVTGVQTLTLQATNAIANSIDYDHADWAGAKLVAAVASPSATLAAQVAMPSIIASVPVVNVTTGATTALANTMIGSVGQIGAAAASGSSVSITGVGTGIGGTADAVDYAYQALSGDGTIVAHLATSQSGDSEAGVMIRESLDAGSKQVALTLGQNTVNLAQRGKTGAKAKVAVAKVGKKAVMPDWVKLVRAGNTFTAYDSTDGVHWKKVGATTIQMGATVDVGLVGASGTTQGVTNSVFSDVQLTEPKPTTKVKAAAKPKK
jgi:hypothetical protein